MLDARKEDRVQVALTQFKLALMKELEKKSQRHFVYVYENEEAQSYCVLILP